MLALYVTENAPDVFDGREVDTSLLLYHHVDSDAIAENQEKVRSLLRNTISADKLFLSPELLTPNFRRETTEIIIKHSDRKYDRAFFFLMDPDLDWDETLSLNITMSDDYFLLISKLHKIKEAILEPASLFTESFLYFLKEQDLRALHINCVVDDCIFKNMDEGNPLFEKLQDVLQIHCKDLSVLTLRCACREHGSEMVSHMAKLVRQVPYLRKIRFAASVEAISELTVELEDLLGLGVSIEFNVYRSHVETVCTGLRHHFDLVKAVTVKHAGIREVVDLVVFENIEELELELMSGGEIMLVAVPSENIQTLRIKPSPLAAIWHGKVYYEPSGNALRMAMSYMPRLNDVTIINCRIKTVEMYRMMQQLGNNLEKLEVSILDQEECPSKRLLNICTANNTFNFNIRWLKIVDNVDEGFTKVLKWRTETYEQYNQLYQKLLEAQEMLTRVAPRLEPWHLANAIESLLPDPDVIEEVQSNAFDIYPNSPVTTDEE